MNTGTDKYNLKQRTKTFAHDCIKLTTGLPNSYLSNHINKQLIRCCTSVAANYRATCLAKSKKAFIVKISIVIEEVDECLFWLEFALEERLTDFENCKSLLKEADELTRIFISSRKTANLNLNK